MMNPFSQEGLDWQVKVNGDLIENKILSGVRVSGKICNNLTGNFFNMFR